jgi:Na+/phosphate symporter
MMMCAERMQRIFLAIILGINMGLAVTQPQIAFLVQLAVIVLLLVGGFTGKCLSLEILRQFIPPCDADGKEPK